VFNKMPETTTYEIVGNYIRQTRPGLVTFTPIFAPGNSFAFHDSPVDGMSIGGLKIQGASPFSGQTFDVKPSYEEFKNTIMKKIEGASSGGRKTRRRV
jgi:hypothetical protein